MKARISALDLDKTEGNALPALHMDRVVRAIDLPGPDRGNVKVWRLGIDLEIVGKIDRDQRLEIGNALDRWVRLFRVMLIILC